MISILFDFHRIIICIHCIVYDNHVAISILVHYLPFAWVYSVFSVLYNVCCWMCWFAFSMASVFCFPLPKHFPFLFNATQTGMRECIWFRSAIRMHFLWLILALSLADYYIMLNWLIHFYSFPSIFLRSIWNFKIAKMFFGHKMYTL